MNSRCGGCCCLGGGGRRRGRVVLVADDVHVVGDFAQMRESAEYVAALLMLATLRTAALARVQVGHVGAPLLVAQVAEEHLLVLVRQLDAQLHVGLVAPQQVGRDCVA